MFAKPSNSRISRRRFLALTGMTVAAGALAACAPVAPAAAPAGDTAEGSQPSTEGRTFSIFAANHHTDNVKGLWVPLFEEKTGATVEWIEIGGGDADAKLAVFVATQDSTADVSYSWETFTAKYGRTLFEDLTDLVDADLLAGLAPAATKALSFLGKPYGVPFDSNQAIFMMNNDIYASAGLDPAAPPESWEQFMEFSEQTTVDGRYATLFTMGDGNSTFVTYISLFNSTGGQLLSDDLTKLQLNTDEGLLAMTAIYDAFVTHPVADPAGITIASSIEQGKVFRAGNMAHYFAFPNHYTLANDPTQSEVVGKVTTSIIPGMTLRSGSVNAFEGYSINQFSENKDLGVLWLEHIISPEVQKLVAINWGRPPALLSTYDDAEVAEKSPQFATVHTQGEYPSPRYGSPFYFDVGTVFNQHMLSLINDEITPQEAVDRIQSDGQKLIDDYWAKAASSRHVPSMIAWPHTLIEASNAMSIDPGDAPASPGWTFFSIRSI